MPCTGFPSVNNLLEDSRIPKHCWVHGLRVFAFLTLLWLTIVSDVVFLAALDVKDVTVVGFPNAHGTRVLAPITAEAFSYRAGAATVGSRGPPPPPVPRGRARGGPRQNPQKRLDAFEFAAKSKARAKV